MTDKGPLVSVIIPCRNHARELRRCLGALSAQSLVGGFEVIIVDSAADEEVVAAARSFEGTRLVRSREDLLPGRARNVGAQYARSTYLAFIDADCTPEPDWLLEAVTALEEGAKMVGGAVLDGDPWNPIAMIDNLMQFSDLPAGRPQGQARILPSCNLALRCADFRESGGFPKIDFPAGEDVLFCNRAAEMWGERLQFVPTMRVRHFGRSGLRQFWVHQDLFGYARAFYGLELRPIYRRLGKFGVFAPAIVLKRLVYILRRVVAWNSKALVPLMLLLPLALYGLAAWSWGFRRGCRVYAGSQKEVGTRSEMDRVSGA